MNLVLFISCFVAFMIHCECYKPIILMHGVNPGYKEMAEMKRYIHRAHPGTPITYINVFSNLFSSFDPLWTQTKVVQRVMRGVMKDSKDGVHLICYSQGGLICRAILQILPDHNVDTMVALSCPLVGQYGDTSYFRYFFPQMLKRNIYKLFYTKFWQNTLSVANYWNDPHHQDLYEKVSVFLPILNNQTRNPHSHDYKKNFLRLKHLVAIGGPDDGVITPWQSSQFGYYDKNEKILPFRKHEWYSKDSFGLRTLARRGGLHMYTVSGVQHINWHKNQTVFDRYILKWLT